VCLLLLANRRLALGQTFLPRLLARLRLGLTRVDGRLAARDLRLLGGQRRRLLLHLRFPPLQFLGGLLELAHARLDLRLALGRERVLGDHAVLELGETLLLAADQPELLGDAALALLELGLGRREPGGAFVELRGAAVVVDAEIGAATTRAGFEVDQRGLQVALAGQRGGELTAKRLEIGLGDPVRSGRRRREGLLAGSRLRGSLGLTLRGAPKLRAEAGSEPGLGVARVRVLGHVFRSCLIG
jgi:hypothetical protein